MGTVAVHRTDATRVRLPRLADDPRDEAIERLRRDEGQGTGGPKTIGPAQSKRRAQSPGWLKVELPAWKRVAMTVGPGNQELVSKMLAHGKGDADLSGVGDETPLSLLPEAERKEWQALWAEVVGLLAKVRKT